MKMSEKRRWNKKSPRKKARYLADKRKRARAALERDGERSCYLVDHGWECIRRSVWRLPLGNDRMFRGTIDQAYNFQIARESKEAA